MKKYRNFQTICPYCGKSDSLCSEIKSLSHAWARSACFKKHGGVSMPLSKLSTLDDDLPENDL